MTHHTLGANERRSGGQTRHRVAMRGADGASAIAVEARLQMRGRVETGERGAADRAFRELGRLAGGQRRGRGGGRGADERVVAAVAGAHGQTARHDRVRVTRVVVADYAATCEVSPSRIEHDAQCRQ